MDADPETGDFLNLINSSLTTDTSVVKFSRRSVQKFLNEKSQVNRQTDDIQTDKRQTLHNVLCGRHNGDSWNLLETLYYKTVTSQNVDRKTVDIISFCGGNLAWRRMVLIEVLDFH